MAVQKKPTVPVAPAKKTKVAAKVEKKAPVDKKQVKLPAKSTKAEKPVAKAPPAPKVSAMEKQKAYAEKLMSTGKMTRKQVAAAVAEKFSIALSSSTSYVYRWFIGDSFKPVPKKVKAAPVAKEKAKAPVKVPVKVPVKAKVEAKAPAPAKAKGRKMPSDSEFEF